MNDVKKDESKENLNTTEINRDGMIKKDDDTSLNDTSKDTSEYSFKEKLNLPKSEISEKFSNPDLFNDNKIKNYISEAKENTVDNISVSNNNGYLDKHKLDLAIKEEVPDIDEKNNEVTKKRK